MKRFNAVLTVPKMTTLSLLSLTTMWLPCVTVYADTYTKPHSINKVTVYSAHAMITRVAKYNLTLGEHELVLDKLPYTLNVDSLRASGSGRALVTLGSVDSKVIATDSLVQAKEQKLQSEIIKVEDAIVMLNNDIDSLNIRLDFIKNLGQNVPETLNNDIKSGSMKPKMWREAWENIGQGASETYRAIAKNNQQLRLKTDSLKKLKTQIAQIQTGNRMYNQVKVKVAVKQAGNFTLAVSYDIAGASWQPVYDARLNVEQSEITLTQYGQVQQRTGEDWSKVKLTLSTSNLTQGVALPDLQPWLVRIREPQIQNKSRQPRTSSTMSIQSAMSAAPVALEQDSVAQYAVSNVSEFAAEYSITGLSTIAANQSGQKFTINQNKLSSKLAARVVPKKNPRAFLYAEATYTGKAPLLAGSVSMFRDNTFIGKLDMPLLRPSEKIKLSFGVDERIKVEYRMIDDKKSTQGFLSSDNVIHRLYRINITNHHKIPFRIDLLEQIPVSQDEDIQIELSDKTTAPTDSNIDDRAGVMVWSYLYQPNDKKDLTVGYLLRYPKDKILQGFN